MRRGAYEMVVGLLLVKAEDTGKEQQEERRNWGDGDEE